MTSTTATQPAVTTRTYADYGRPLWRRVLFTRESAIIALLVVVIVVASVSVPRSPSPITMTYLFLDIAPILLIALPMTLVIITGEIDLSVASMVGLTSVTLGLLHQGGHADPRRRRGRAPRRRGRRRAQRLPRHPVGLPSLAVTIGTLALYRGLAVGLLGTKAVTEFTKYWTDLTKSRSAPPASRWS